MKNNNNILSINEDPFNLFSMWFSLAQKNEINDPNAMNISTVDHNLQPTSRLVLMKSFDKEGFVFYTNLNSKKASAISKNSQVCLNFYWKSLRKQVRIEGVANLLDDEESDKYFETRSEGSKIGAWASNQSGNLKKREDLISKVKFFEEKFDNKKIPRPSFWSGYRVTPNLFEFWQHMPFRLHDRLEFTKIGNSWKVKKLYP